MNKKNLAILGGGLITLSAIGAIVCSSVTIYMTSRVSNRVSFVQNDVTALSKAYIKEEAKHTDAEYVTIANQFKIMDTSAISNAYKNKDDSQLTTPEDKETLKMASDLLGKIINDKMSLYEKELAIHDWLTSNVGQSNDNLSSVPMASGPKHTPYGVLKYKQAVCAGYATTFKLLMNMSGAECMVEHSVDLGHSWDVVKLDDNQWYIVDPYNDAKSDSDEKSTCSHKLFNVTNDYFLNGQAFDTSLYPVASGTKYNYAVQNATKVDDIKKLPALIKDAVSKHSSEAYFELPKNSDYKYVGAILNGVTNRISTNSDSFDSHYTILDDSTTILGVSFMYNSNEQTEEKSYPDLTKELDNLFGAISNDAPEM